MHKIEMYFLLWTAYLASIVFMLADMRYSHYTTYREKYLFYLLTNTTLLLRVIGAYWVILIIHAVAPFFILFVLFYMHLDTIHLKSVPVMFIWVPLTIQLVLTFILFYLRMNGSAEDKGFYAGIHAHFGILVIVVLFWNICHIVKESAWCGLSSMGYMLMYMAITLTPHFQGLGKTILSMELQDDEPIETLTSLGVDCGPAAPGHRRVL